MDRVCLVIHGGFDGKWGGDDLAAAESELAPQPVCADRVEVDVYGQVGPERSAGEREDRGAGAVADVGVLMGEGPSVGAHDDDVAGGGQVGLEVAQRLARACIGEAECQVAGRVGLCLAVQLDALDRTAAALGCSLEHPCMTLSFLSLTVIPELRLTDRGLVDVSAERLIPVGVIP